MKAIVTLIAIGLVTGCAAPGAPTAGDNSGAEDASATKSAYLPERLLNRLREAMPELTDEQLRNLALAGGAGYVLSKSGSTTATSNSPVIRDKNIALSPSVAISLDKIVGWGSLAGVAYMVLDPLNPNWEIEQAAFPKNMYHLSLKMKRYYTGGAGEARMVFQERAKELMRQGGFDGFTIVEYNESLDSSVIGSQRHARGVIQLTRS